MFNLKFEKKNAKPQSVISVMVLIQLADQQLTSTHLGLKGIRANSFVFKFNIYLNFEFIASHTQITFQMTSNVIGQCH